MSWPSTILELDKLDQFGDNPGEAREQILLGIQALKLIIQCFGLPNGVASLNAQGHIEDGQLSLDNFLRPQNNLSELDDAQEARQNLGITGIGGQVLQSANIAVLLQALGVSAYMQTLLNDINAHDVLETLTVTQVGRDILTAQSIQAIQNILGIQTQTQKVKAFGYVAADGNARSGSLNLSSSERNEEGRYTINFIQAISNPAVLATAINPSDASNFRNIYVNQITSTSVIFEIREGVATSNPDNNAFSFLIVGN